MHFATIEIYSNYCTDFLSEYNYELKCERKSGEKCGGILRNKIQEDAERPEDCQNDRAQFPTLEK